MESVPLQLSPSCRILTISSSLQRAVSFVEQIQSLSQSSSGSSGTAPGGTTLWKEVASSQEEAVSSQTQEKLIPWTISNKYYSADVHFFVRDIKGLAPYLFKDAPALIFVWRKGEAYRHHIHRLSQDLAGTEPEVALAVRLESSIGSETVSACSQSNEDSGDEEGFEDSSEIDEFLSSRGFEFVDVPLMSDNGNLGDEILDGIPSLPRVLDALSTIMWPSMQAATKQKRNPHSSKGLQDVDDLLDWANSSFDSSEHFPLHEDLVVPATHSSSLALQTRKQKEMDELARWLREDDIFDSKTKNDPWQSRTSKLMTTSPIDERSSAFLSLTAPSSTAEKVIDGFDDDFTVFVSASSAESLPSSSERPRDQHSQEETSFGSFDDETSFDLGRLVPQHDSVMYHTLGSASDLTEVTRSDVVLKDGSDDNEEGLPSEDEIRASAARIFGAASTRSAESEDETEYDMAAFDLSYVFSALQGMKAEIAGIEDVDDRREAAAKVALGLVYGLERDSGPSQ
ncbi:hypothetical protein K435DRAFT_837102 [Dendrothele bispora CBS 962.96]|uniref:Uncharacterized protein n=1 Tax=Dendrothele bispora (strain CBS 962.96) TaxID=1314807 RepID=A0A4S8ME68_DENBC|nr:hypothetical protein K435DRAFT_837102 [Dendrothele bispora CBS 962.96]